MIQTGPAQNLYIYIYTYIYIHIYIYIYGWMDGWMDVKDDWKREISIEKKELIYTVVQALCTDSRRNRV